MLAGDDARGVRGGVEAAVEVCRIAGPRVQPAAAAERPGRVHRSARHHLSGAGHQGAAGVAAEQDGSRCEASADTGSTSTRLCGIS